NTTLLVWLIFLAIGGGLLALYYARIGYIPDIEWSASLVYLAAASAIGGGVGLVLALSVLLPGLIWAQFLVADPKLSALFCYDETIGEPCVRSIFYKVGVWFGGFVLLSHLALKLSALGYWIVATVLLFGSFVMMRWQFEKLLIKANDAGEKDKRTFKYSA